MRNSAAVLILLGAGFCLHSAGCASQGAGTASPRATTGPSTYPAEPAREGDPDTKVATPVFDGAREEEITGLLASTNPTRDGVQLIGSTGKARLYDGRSGEPFPEPVSVGYTYILKLLHLVDGHAAILLRAERDRIDDPLGLVAHRQVVHRPMLPSPKGS